MQAQQYRGEGDASQELLAFALRSTALSKEQQQQPVVPFLPSGSIVSGLPAALLTQAECAGLPAELLVVVEQVPSLVPETLAQLAEVVVKALRQQPTAAGGDAWVKQLVSGPVVDAARTKLQRSTHRPSSVYS